MRTRVSGASGAPCGLAVAIRCAAAEPRERRALDCEQGVRRFACTQRGRALAAEAPPLRMSCCAGRSRAPPNAGAAVPRTLHAHASAPRTAAAARAQGSWCERLLKSMYYVTQRHGGSCPQEIQTLWRTLAALKDNVRHMLLFLVDMGMAAGQQVRVGEGGGRRTAAAVGHGHGGGAAGAGLCSS